MSTKVSAGTVILLVGSMMLFGCQAGQYGPSAQRESKRQEQELPLTLGGFLKDGPETEKLDGVCGPDETRNVVSCDVYNGLPAWTITEVTFVVTWSPYKDDDKRYYRIPVNIRPMTTEHVVIRLGLRLPPDERLTLGGKARIFSKWGWQILGARGYPAN